MIDSKQGPVRHLFIIDPAAGQKRPNARREELLSGLSIPYEKVYTTGEGHAEQLAREAAGQGGPVREKLALSAINCEQ